MFHSDKYCHAEKHLVHLYETGRARNRQRCFPALIPRGGSRRQRPQFFLCHRLQQRSFASLRATECSDGLAKCSISEKVVESVRDVALLPAPPSSTATTFKGSVDDSADSRNSSTASGCIIAARLGGSSVGRTRYGSPISVTLDQGSKLPVVASAAAGRKA